MSWMSCMSPLVSTATLSRTTVAFVLTALWMLARGGLEVLAGMGRKEQALAFGIDHDPGRREQVEDDPLHRAHHLRQRRALRTVQRGEPGVRQAQPRGEGPHDRLSVQRLVALEDAML